MQCVCALLLTLLMGFIYEGRSYNGHYLGLERNVCDEEAAAACEYELLKCKIFTGPAGDEPTLCRCGSEFWGNCLRKAGCETSRQVDPLSEKLPYMQLCVKHIIQYNCPDVTMCSINCASDGVIDRDSTKIIPFNNYGKYYLRVRSCNKRYHANKLEKYAVIEQVACEVKEGEDVSDFATCARFIPPLHFVPVALPKNTTYIEVDNCELLTDGTYHCHVTSEPKPVRLYGNEYIFPRTFDVAQSKDSVCTSDDQCTGSYCDTQFRPPVCSPKTSVHVEKAGTFYFSDPFG